MVVKYTNQGNKNFQSCLARWQRTELRRLLKSTAENDCSPVSGLKQIDRDGRVQYCLYFDTFRVCFECVPGEGVRVHKVHYWRKKDRQRFLDAMGF